MMNEEIEVVKLDRAETQAMGSARPRGKYGDVYEKLIELKSGESLKVSCKNPALQVMNTLWCRLHRNKVKGFSFRRLDDHTLVIIRLEG